MKFKSKVLGYALAFGAGTIFSVPAAVAATNYVQAQRTQSTIQFAGKTISQPPALVYGGSTYVQLYSIQQALKQIGMNPGWNGSVFTMHQSDISGMSLGSTDNTIVDNDLNYSLLNVGSAGDNVSNVSKDSADYDVIITAIEDNISNLQKDAPTDPKLQSILNDYFNTLNQEKTVFTDFKQAAEQNDDGLLQTAKGLVDPMLTSIGNVTKEIQDYTPPSN